MERIPKYGQFLLKRFTQQSRQRLGTPVAAYIIAEHILSPATVCVNVHGTYCRQSSERKINPDDEDDDDDNIMMIIILIETC